MPLGVRRKTTAPAALICFFSETLIPWRFYSVDEKLDHLLRAGARLAAGDPAVLAQRELLALQQLLGVAFEGDVGAVGAVVLEHPLVLAPLDGAVAPRGHVVGDRE